MLIDCDSCRMRDLACGDCVVTVLLARGSTHGGGDRGAREQLVELDSEEQTALAVLASSGLVPPLRLLQGTPGDGQASELERADTPRSTSREGDAIVKRRATG